MAEAASSAERPIATASVWTTSPVEAPAKAAKPAARDWLTALPTNIVMSGPGVSVSTTTATR